MNQGKRVTFDISSFENEQKVTSREQHAEGSSRINTKRKITFQMKKRKRKVYF